MIWRFIRFLGGDCCQFLCHETLDALELNRLYRMSELRKFRRVIARYGLETVAQDTARMEQEFHIH